MRSVGALLSLLVVAPLFSQDHPLIRSLDWGSTPETVARSHHLLREGKDSTVERFLCAIDSLDGAAVEECRLEFLEGELAGIAVTTLGRHNSRLLLQALLRRHGEGIWEDSLSVQWMVGETHVAYDEDSAGDACVYWYRRNAPWQK